MVVKNRKQGNKIIKIGFAMFLISCTFQMNNTMLMTSVAIFDNKITTWKLGKRICFDDFCQTDRYFFQKQGSWSRV